MIHLGQQLHKIGSPTWKINQATKDERIKQSSNKKSTKYGRKLARPHFLDNLEDKD